jgi:hypothetical protein
MIGLEPWNTFETSIIWKKLQTLIRLKGVKDTVKALSQHAQKTITGVFRKTRIQLPIGIHRAFSAPKKLVKQPWRNFAVNFSGIWGSY